MPMMFAGPQRLPLATPPLVPKMEGSGVTGALPNKPNWGNILAAFAGGAADGVLQGSGMAPVFGPQMQRRQLRRDQLEDEARRQAEQIENWRMQRNEEAARPRYFQNNAGDYVQFDPASGQSSVVYDGPEKAVTPTALEQQIALYRKLNPSATDTDVAEIVKRGISGAQYDPSVYRPMVDYKAASSAALKAVPTYAQTHPKAPRPRAAPKPPSGFILD